MTSKRPSLVCRCCRRRPVMDRCAICEECWYSSLAVKAPEQADDFNWQHGVTGDEWGMF